MWMKRGAFRLVCAIAAMGFFGAGLAQEVSYNYDRTADFSKFKTYKWVPIQGAQHPDQLTDKSIVAAIDAQLASKGLAKKDADPVDLYVGYGVTIDKEKEITGFGGGLGWRWGGGMATATTSTIQNGTILLDVYDPAPKNLIWRGTATESLDPGASPDKQQQRLEKAMAKLLKDFPPPPPKK